MSTNNTQININTQINVNTQDSTFELIETPIESQIWRPEHCDVEYLKECKGEMISIIGKLVGQQESDSNYAIFVGCDGKLFNVIFPHKKIKFKKSYNQIHGIVQNDLSILHKSHYSISDSFCLWTWNKIIQLMRKHPEIFN